MATIELQAIVEGARRDLDRLGEKIEAQIITRSLNRTITGVKTEARRRAGKDIALPQRRISKDLVVTRARMRQHHASLLVTARATPLIEFSVTELAKRRGVSVRVKRRGARKRLRHAFVATMPGSGHRGVFERQTRGGRPVPRLKIEELFSTALAQFFDDASIVRALAEKARTRFAREFQANLDFHS